MAKSKSVEIVLDVEPAIADIKRIGVLTQVFDERRKQDDHWGVQRHPDTMLGHIQPGEDEFMATYLREGLILATEQKLEQSRDSYDESVKMGVTNWAEILEEEFWEAILEAYIGDKAKLRKELIQVAAVAVAWVECLDATES